MHTRLWAHPQPLYSSRPVGLAEQDSPCNQNYIT